MNDQFETLSPYTTFYDSKPKSQNSKINEASGTNSRAMLKF